MTTTAPAPARAASPQANAPAFRWLFPAGLFSLLAIGLLWAIRPSVNDCYELCPNGQSVTTDSPAIVAGGIMIAIYAALVAVALTVYGRPQRTITLWLLSGGLAFVFLVAVLVSLTLGHAPVPVPYGPSDCPDCGVIVN